MRFKAAQDKINPERLFVLTSEFYSSKLFRPELKYVLKFYQERELLLKLSCFSKIGDEHGRYDK